MIITVTEDLIKPIGSPELPPELRPMCPIVRAFHRVGIYATVGPHKITLYENKIIDYTRSRRFHSTSEMIKFVERFDKGLPVEPITIDTDQLTEITEPWQV